MHHDSSPSTVTGRYSGATSIADIEKLMAHPARHREQAGKIYPPAIQSSASVHLSNKVSVLRDQIPPPLRIQLNLLFDQGRHCVCIISNSAPQVVISQMCPLSEQIFRLMWPLPGLGCQADRQRWEVGLIGCGAVALRSTAVVEVQVAADRTAGLADAVVGLQIYLLIFDAAPRRSTKTLSRQAPLPSMLIAMSLPASTPVKVSLVNCEP